MVAPSGASSETTCSGKYSGTTSEEPKHSQGCAHAACQLLQKSIDDVVRERSSGLAVRRTFTLTQSGRPRRVKRRWASNHGGKTMRSTSAEEAGVTLEQASTATAP